MPIAHYLDRFARLRTDASRARWSATTCYRAPHKPLLLLAVTDLFAQNAAAPNLIEINPELGELFTLYWARVMPPDQRGNLALPFFFLRSDGFWHLVPRRGKRAILEANLQLRSISQLRDTILGARLDDELYELMRVEESRNLLRATLIENYFSAEAQPGLLEQGAINVEAFTYSQTLLEQARLEKAQLAGKEPSRPAARDQGFRRAVVTAYDHRCALCGIRMSTPDGHTVVDAAHIVPWSVSRNDDPRNGMSLCKLCHWVFDEGMVAVTTFYVILISPQVTANRNLPGHIVTLRGRGIIGPDEQRLWPDLHNLTWHRQRVYRNR